MRVWRAVFFPRDGHWLAVYLGKSNRCVGVDILHPEVWRLGEERPSLSYLGTWWHSRSQAPCSSSPHCFALHSVVFLGCSASSSGHNGVVGSEAISKAVKWLFQKWSHLRLLPLTDIAVALSLMWRRVCPCLGHFRPQ